ncbi:ABC transporter permease [Magnetospira sp. QH-2]|uniref:ABC transporter permease n=1 Tax=Magnetospira sp. (strain QH-2) TaxID=1288970 RepID=UPI0003E816A1|nr:ABC transporter permease [Magnetospira sp. QH-2]CCQ72035.1 ABC transporter, membrane subunit [Magnetospira sp. QH-2]
MSLSHAALWFSWRRVGGIMLRHLYVLRSSWPRLLELAYWPFVQMITWGFVTSFFLEHSSYVAQAAGVLISAVLLWDILFRANLGISLSFMEEMWSRNLGQLYVSPLRPMEHVAALMSMSLIRTAISVTPAALLSLPLYDVWVFALGPPLIAFFVALMIFGWSIGLLVSALVLRFGMGAESLAWVAIFAVAPLSGIYYPVETLPEWLRPVSYALPSSHVFEGMRAVLQGEGFRMDHFLWSLGLNGIYLSLAGGWFLFTLRVARIKGLLLQQGE